MMRSMYSGVSGLRVHQTKMDVIGNNIANVNTVGFKSSRALFSEIFSQTVRSASGANDNKAGTNPIQVGLGSSLASIDVNMTEGASQRTDNALDMKIEGSGFFVVRDSSGYKFTRAGAFIVDNIGNLATPDGLNVMGWGVGSDGNIQKETVQPIRIFSPENVFAEPEMTKKAIFGGNINMNDPQLDPAEGGVPFAMTIYDSLGYPYTVEMNIQFDETTPGPPPTTTYDVILEDVKDQNGESIGSGAGSVKLTIDGDTGKVIPNDVPSTGDATFDITGLTSTNSTFQDPITVDFSSVTMFSGKTTIEGRAGDIDGLEAGNPAGTMSGYEVSSDGKILGLYSNGASKLLGQIAIADFENPAGLKKVGSNLFAATTNSGEFDGIGMDVTANGGSINAGVLEMSNVDLSTEFTEMITTQRGFQANSRIITSSDEMLQELVNLKR